MKRHGVVGVGARERAEAALIAAEPLSPAERAQLLGVARDAVRRRAGGDAEPEVPLAGRLGEPRGVFVTLRRGGELRGCIGTLAPREPLARAVARMAAAAAAEDPRFDPVRPEEVDELSISISALGALRPVKAATEIEIGRDGVVVQLGWQRGTLLPVVAVENRWGPEELLRHTCLKAGLRPDAWRDPAARVQIFSAEEFSG